jgi:hypothetical protein
VFLGIFKNFGSFEKIYGVLGEKKGYSNFENLFTHVYFPNFSHNVPVSNHTQNFEFSTQKDVFFKSVFFTFYERS